MPPMAAANAAVRKWSSKVFLSSANPPPGVGRGRTTGGGIQLAGVIARPAGRDAAHRESGTQKADKHEEHEAIAHFAGLRGSGTRGTDAKPQVTRR